MAITQSPASPACPEAPWPHGAAAKASRAVNSKQRHGRAGGHERRPPIPTCSGRIWETATSPCSPRARPRWSSLSTRATRQSSRRSTKAVAAVFPGVGVHEFLRMGSSVTAVQANHPALPFAFPQHGRGRKHTRRIILTDWQRALTHAHPKELLRGLIHSDGCRTVNRFKTKLPSGRVAEYEYPRYFFSNLSADIRGLFCEYCERLGVRWTQSNHRNISVSHRRSVAILDGFIGPKS